MLREHGEVIGVDTGDAAATDGVEVHGHSDGRDLLDRVRTVVKSPGVPREAPVVQAAIDRGMTVAGELELAWRLLPQAQFVAVTGTNGKTTTTELLGAIGRAAGIDVHVAGNVGTALSSLVGHVREGTTIVCECPSFQLEDSSAFAPEAALLLNLEEDHLDRHRTFEAYRDATLPAFAHQGPEDVAVSPRALDLALPGRAQRVTFGPGGTLDRRDGALWWRGEHVIDASAIRLRGEHNVENAVGCATA